MRTVDEVIARLSSRNMRKLEAPPYKHADGNRVGFAVASMKDHTTDEGWQLFAGLAGAGYQLHGHGLPSDLTDVARSVRMLDPAVAVVQDQREWDVQPGDFRESRARFTNIDALRSSRAFVLTVLKDAHQRPSYHAASAVAMGCHAWIVYYHPRIVKHLASYVREEHLVRTYHSLDPALVPPFSATRRGCLISGAVGRAYPLRSRLFDEHRLLPDATVIHHPGYHRSGCATPQYLRTLSNFKVAICTSSVYGYALRKIIEATACGCVVVTDLPTDEVLPGIDCNLVRVGSDKRTKVLAPMLLDLYASYDPEKQRAHAEAAKKFYCYRTVGRRLADDIEKLRARY